MSRVLALVLALTGCTVETVDPDRAPVPAEVPMVMEMEDDTMMSDPPPDPPPDTDPPPEPPPPPPPDDPPPEPAFMQCAHTYGGIYDHLGCSMGYQCFDGAWRTRTESTVCACVEPTGTVGCTTSGEPPPEPPPPDPMMSMPPATSSSESIGSPNAGRQERSMRIPAGSSYVVGDTGRGAYFGTEETIYWLRAAFDRVATEHPAAALPQVRDISIADGGVPSGPWPHSSHESGRDADVTYYLDSCSTTSGCPLADVPLADFDAAATWTAFETWIRAGVITYIFVDHALQRPLYEEAMRRGATSTELSRWFQYPRSASERVGLIRHVDNHRNHYHVRFTCPTDDPDCIE